MKKIVALVLCLVLALSLCTVAFAAADEYNLYQATSENLKDGKLVAKPTALTDNATLTPAKTNADGSGNLEYFTAGTRYFVKVDAAKATASDYAVTADTKTDILFYVTEVKAKAEYVGTATEFTNFGTTTGKLNDTAPITDKYYKVTKADSTATVKADKVYKVATTGETLLVDGKLVTVDTTAKTLVPANLVAVEYKVVDGKKVPTKAIDTNDNSKAYTAIYEKDKNPAGTVGVEITNETGYVVVMGTTSGTTDKTVESAKTFDAGIALYAGMALASVAGSAVVIGKKKEF